MLLFLTKQVNVWNILFILTVLLIRSVSLYRYLGFTISSSGTFNQCKLDLYKKSMKAYFKGILSTSCVIFSYPKLLSISVLTFIKWRLTPSYVAKDTKKTQNYRYQNYFPDDNIQICSYGLLCEHVLSMRTV